MQDEEKAAKQVMLLNVTLQYNMDMQMQVTL